MQVNLKNELSIHTVTFSHTGAGGVTGAVLGLGLGCTAGAGCLPKLTIIETVVPAPTLLPALID